jgi:hypothetical protein
LFLDRFNFSLFNLNNIMFGIYVDGVQKCFSVDEQNAPTKERAEASAQSQAQHVADSTSKETSWEVRGENGNTVASGKCTPTPKKQPVIY